MSFLINILIGVVIGVGFIIPGVSGGALAVILGVYEKIFNSIKDIKNKNNFIFLMLIIIGIMLGVVGFGNILLILLEYREVPTKYIFLGLLIGGIPALIKSIREKSKKSFKITPFSVSIIISILLFIFENTEYGLNIGNELLNGNVPIMGLFFAGILYAIGKIVPGISGAALLMLVGMYEYLLNLVANPLAVSGNILLSLIPFFVGVFIGVLVLFKLLNFLFAKYYIQTYSAILGFVLGSLLYLFPGFDWGFSGIICIILLLSSTVLSYILTN